MKKQPRRGCNMSSISNYSYTFCTQSIVNKSRFNQKVERETCNLSMHESVERKSAQKKTVWGWALVPFSLLFDIFRLCDVNIEDYLSAFVVFENVFRRTMNNKRIKWIFRLLCNGSFKSNRVESTDEAFSKASGKLTTKWWHWQLMKVTTWCILTAKLLPLQCLTDYIAVRVLETKEMTMMNSFDVDSSNDSMISFNIWNVKLTFQMPDERFRSFVDPQLDISFPRHDALKNLSSCIILLCVSTHKNDNDNSPEQLTMKTQNWLHRVEMIKCEWYPY